MNTNNITHVHIIRESAIKLSHRLLELNLLQAVFFYGPYKTKHFVYKSLTQKTIINLLWQ